MPSSKRPSPRKPPTPAFGDHSSDSDLLAGIAAGSAVAFDVLFARFSSGILVFVTRLAGRQIDPDDLLQETFLRVLRHAGTYRSGYPVRPWLYAIARHVVFDALKRRARGAQTISSKPDDGEDFWARQPSHEPSDSPASAPNNGETREKVIAALERLPAAHREVVILGYFEQMSYEQISQITLESEGTLRSRMFYALRKLKDIIKEMP